MIVRGFTLVELAMVLLIIGLLLGGLLMPLASQIEQRDRRLVSEQINEIKKALFGYAVINQSLPCPGTETDITDSDYGMEDVGNCSLEGYVPWKMLGTSENDPWGNKWRYRVDTNFTNPITLTTSTMSSLSVNRIISGVEVSLTSASEPPIVIIYSYGPNGSADSLNADADNTEFQGGEPIGDDFDDIASWITRPLLFNTLISAKILPN